MESAILTLAHALDVSRSQTLRLTLALAPLRAIFVNRARRLLALYLLAFAGYLVAALFFPLWVLVAGPVVYGAPHLFASIRYVHYTIAPGTRAKRSLFRLLCGVSGAVAAFRILTDSGVIPPEVLSPGSELPEALSMLAVFAGAAVIYRRGATRVALGALALAPLVLAAWRAPLWTAGVLVLAHNAVAFIYWILSARTRAERRVAWFATALFALANAAIFLGAFDFLYRHFTPVGFVEAAGLDYSDLGKMIFPGSESYTLWFHGVVAYAFGQALHYFVWLKAVPDQHHHHDVPTTFRQSYRLLSADFGRRLTYVAFGACAAMGLVWALYNLVNARMIYFALAAFHGYLELAGLSLASLRERVA